MSAKMYWYNNKTFTQKALVVFLPLILELSVSYVFLFHMKNINSLFFMFSFMLLIWCSPSCYTLPGRSNLIWYTIARGWASEHIVTHSPYYSYTSLKKELRQNVCSRLKAKMFARPTYRDCRQCGLSLGPTSHKHQSRCNDNVLPLEWEHLCVQAQIFQLLLWLRCA